MERNFSGAPGQTGSGSGRGGEIRQQTRQQGQRFTQQARQQAGDLANRGGEQVKSQLANQKHEASQRLAPVQTALRETAQQLRKQGQATARYADNAADGVERFSGYLRETDVDDIADEARGFARSKPALFLGSAALLGFLGTRFLKSSSQGAPSGGNGQPVAALPPGPAERGPAAVGRTPTTPTVRRTPLANEPPVGEDLAGPPRGY